MSRVVRARPKAASQLVEHQTGGDPAQSRINDQVAEQLAKPAAQRSVAFVDLIVGVNRINHGLAGRARGAIVAPTVADATFAYSWAVDNDRQVVITVVGVAQPGAAVEAFR